MKNEKFKNLHFQLSADDIKQLDKWKVSRGMKSRSEAVRAMLRIVTKNNIPEATPFNKNSFSDDALQIGQSKPNEEFETSTRILIRSIIREEILKILGKNK